MNGFCDFVITRAPQQPEILSPVMVIFEAKRENINEGLGECIAGMVVAQRYNNKNKTPLGPVYGCVTTGSLWKFLRLSGTTLSFDLREYYHSQPELLLGILTSIVGAPVQNTAAA